MRRYFNFCSGLSGRRTGKRPVKAGQSFSATFIVGCFDSIEEMHQVYDAHRGFTGLTVDEQNELEINSLGLSSAEGDHMVQKRAAADRSNAC